MNMNLTGRIKSVSQDLASRPDQHTMIATFPQPWWRWILQQLQMGRIPSLLYTNLHCNKSTVFTLLLWRKPHVILLNGTSHALRRRALLNKQSLTKSASWRSYKVGRAPLRRPIPAWWITTERIWRNLCSFSSAMTILKDVWRTQNESGWCQGQRFHRYGRSGWGPTYLRKRSYP